MSPIPLLKLLACLHLAAVSAQPVLAGQHFGGSSFAMGIHGPLGELVAWLGLGQAVLACLCGWTGRLGRGPVLVFVGLFGLAGLQVHAGHNGYLALHIPLGSFLLAASALVTVRLLRHDDRTASGLSG